MFIFNGLMKLSGQFLETSIWNTNLQVDFLIRSSVMKRITLFVLMLSIVCIPAFGADTGDGPDLGGKDKILKKSPADLGYTNVPNWLQFPPADHRDMFPICNGSRA